MHSVHLENTLTTLGWLMLCRAARMIPSRSRQQLPMVCVPSIRRSTRRNASSRDTSGCSTSMSGAGFQPPAEAQPIMRLTQICGECEHISQGAGQGRICTWEDEVCTGVHRGAWGRYSKIHRACMNCNQCSRDGSPCPNGNAWRAQQCGSRVAHVTGACDQIRFQARCRVRQGAHMR